MALLEMPTSKVSSNRDAPLGSPNGEQSAESSITSLSDKDKHVLNLLFGKHVAKPQSIVDLSMPPDQHVPTKKVEEYVEIEKQAIKLEKEGRLTDSLRLLDNLILEAPNYASAYNNRAQLRRLMSANLKEALSDLESAVALARPPRSVTRVSKMQAQVLRNAYGQLAALYLEQAKRPENVKRSWELQLKASDMMVEASNYGEHIAASLAVSINPYAKLCGNMVETVLGSYR